MKSGAIRLKKRLAVLAGFVLLSIAAASTWAWDMHRQVKFDADQWKHPHRRWDRWRMIYDLKHQLDQTHPNIDAVQNMLEGDPEKREPHRDQAFKEHVLIYTVGIPFDDFFLPESQEIRIYFMPDGKFGCSELGEGNGDVWW